MNSTQGRGVLDGAFALLDALHAREEASLTALAATSGLPKATAYRLLEQLTRLGAVERVANRYRIGSRLFQLGQSWQPHPGLRRAAARPMRELARVTGASVGVCVLRSGRAVLVSGAPGEGDPLVPLRPGTAFEWPTAVGKMLVAGSATPLDLGSAAWQREAALIRDRGVSFDHEELVPGVSCAAVPVRARDGRTVAAAYALIETSPRLARVTEALRRVGVAIGATLDEPAPARRERVGELFH